MNAIGNYCLWFIKIATYNYPVLTPTLHKYDNFDLRI